MEPSDRIKAARIDAGYETAAEAARAMSDRGLKVAYATYAGHENGSRGLTAKAAQRYARFFGVDLEWLQTGRGAAKKNHKPEWQELYESLPPPEQGEAINFLRYLQSRKA